MKTHTLFLIVLLLGLSLTSCNKDNPVQPYQGPDLASLITGSYFGTYTYNNLYSTDSIVQAKAVLTKLRNSNVRVHVFKGSQTTDTILNYGMEIYTTDSIGTFYLELGGQWGPMSSVKGIVKDKNFTLNYDKYRYFNGSRP